MENQTFQLQTLKKRLSDVSTAPEAELRFIVENVSGVDYFSAVSGLVKISDFRKIEELVRRRISERIPSQYLIGRADFFGLELVVTPDVLIPRQETELLVEKTIELLGCPNAEGYVADIGTGSGCIAIAIAKNCPNLKIVATDISLEALKIAKTNAHKHGVADRIFFVHTDILDGIDLKFDLIVSNPPYVRTPEMSMLPPEVLCEPKIALDGGLNGLKVIKKILAFKNLLKDNGWLVLEISPYINDSVQKLARDLGYSVSFFDDLNGLTRIAVLKPHWEGRRCG